MNLFQKHHELGKPGKTNAWICFFIFVITNGLLSYRLFPLISAPDLFWGTALILTAACWFLCLRFFPLLPVPRSQIDPWKNDYFPEINRALFLSLIGLGVFLRFYKLTSLTHWPLYDETMFGFFGKELSENWSPRLSFGWAQLPPFNFWFLGFLFKLIGPSLFGLWLFPAFFSALTLPAVYFCCREFFRESTARGATLLWALSFWPLYAGRFCVQYPLFVFWGFLTFFCLGRYFNSGPGVSRGVRALLLGGVSGLGFYTNVSWPLILFFVILIFFLHAWKKSPTPIRDSVLFSLPLLLTLAPLALDHFDGRRESYLSFLLATGKNLSLRGYLLNLSSYFTGLFWGVPPSSSVSSYGPHWGGIFNPVFVSLITLGLLQWTRVLRVRAHVVFLSSFIVLFSPALLTRDLEMYRIIQVLPLLFIPLVFGFAALSGPSIGRARKGIFLVLLFLSAGLDIFHLFVPCSRGALIENSWKFKSAESFYAYPYLKKISASRGPGFILLEFNRNPNDKSLELATYSFNPAVNPALARKPTQWAAWIADSSYLPWLRANFTGTEWFPLPEITENSIPREQGLLIVPLTGENPARLKPWLSLNREFQSITASSLNHVSGYPLGSLLETMARLHPVIARYPFWESAFWERTALYEVYSEGEDALYLMGWPRPARFRSRSLNFKMGLMYYKMGIFLGKEGAYSESLSAFKNAGYFHEDFTPPEPVIQGLIKMSKKSL